MNAASVLCIIAALAIPGGLAICLLRVRRRRLDKMREDISLGDDVKTMGGVCGTVVSFTQSEVTIESGSKGSEIVVSRDAITSVTHGRAL